MQRTAQRMSHFTLALGGGLLLAAATLATPALITPRTDNPAAVVQLEGLVVTPTQVYTQQEWQQRRVARLKNAEGVAAAG